MRRGVIIAAVVVYLAVALGCMFGAAGGRGGEEQSWQGRVRPTTQGSRFDGRLPFRGVAMQLQRIDFIDTEYRKSIDEIVDVGADTVLFVIDAHQEHGGSTNIYLDMRLAPTRRQLGDIIDYAKGKGLRVVVMPIVLLDRPRNYNEWRGTIKPDNWDHWWESYRQLMYHFSWICEVHKVDVLSVGSELVSTEGRTEDWRKTIRMMRETFKGMLTYSANWDHYKEVTFWDELDLVSMNSYYKMGDDASVTIPQVKERWRKIQGDIGAFQQTVNKPVMFMEVGWCSQNNAAHEPWDYTLQKPIDLELQRKLYQAFFESWHGVDWFAGFMIWEWPPGDGGAKNDAYTPEGKPAEKVLREWMAKPRWQVK